MLLQVIISGVNVLAPLPSSRESVYTTTLIKASVRLLLRTLSGLWHEERASHTEAALRVLKAINQPDAVCYRTVAVAADAVVWAVVKSTSADTRGG
jgi:hypothetical protein